MSDAMIPYVAVKWLWIVFGSFWLLAAFFQKPNARRQSIGSRLTQMSIILLVLAPFLLCGQRVGLIHRHLYPNLLVVQYFGVLLVVLGFGFAVWARFVLGRNWSGIVTVKEDHTLITSGPYGWVRHPIYTGILLALLGTAITLGTILNMVEVPAVAFALWLKLRTEEKFMLETFGEQYIDYGQRIKALIPHLI
jgi:protein-S-isoprenylcysteine O-methyltransferase Ste14